MSYSQIFRRINRLLKSTINDVVDNLSGDDRELNDFDEELRREQQRQSGSSSGEGRSRGAGGNSTSGRGESSRENSSQDGNQSQGKRKPGEKADAFYYEVLGLTPTATIPEIKKAYRKLMSQYHPDRVATLGAELRKVASDKAKEINEAYSIIERRRGFN